MGCFIWMVKMLQFTIVYSLKEFQILFTVFDRESGLSLQFTIRQYQISSPLLSLATLDELLRKQTAKCVFSLQDMQLQIVVPVGKVKRYIYLPLPQDEPERNRAFLIRATKRLQQARHDTSINAKSEMFRLTAQMERATEEHQSYHDVWCEKKRAIRSYQEEMATLAQQDMKLSRQVITIDEEIMSSKRGVELEQYRLSTISENRQERKKKVYFNELSKLASPKIHKVIKEKTNGLLRLELTQCQIKSMKFLEVFQCLQQLKLGMNMIKKIEGLGPLHQLRKVELQGNLIERMQGFNNNTQIRELRLQRNRIARVQNIFHLCRLEILSLSQNSIQEIPREIRLLEALVQLTIIGNNISHLPNELLSLNKLRTLSIMGNPCAKQTKRNKEFLKRLLVVRVETAGTAL